MPITHCHRWPTASNAKKKVWPSVIYRYAERKSVKREKRLLVKLIKSFASTRRFRIQSVPGPHLARSITHCAKRARWRAALMSFQIEHYRLQRQIRHVLNYTSIKSYKWLQSFNNQQVCFAFRLWKSITLFVPK